ncbi:sensor domain-containing diguanylate cyclase [Pelomonas sp. SE-A7]|uniref:sensor domain-containing diguanylate cyclase n=1 Tax=Pelomonas sp. SE-A7 TaxID=3054953 RepID=UPI00259CCD58|nr:sensor domain-containing diguanylate cyclase [Pelomonas sp. SE-A7]MDM4764484.1 diguanylate cyclase [Pelomonas sp. SE-A7]
MSNLATEHGFADEQAAPVEDRPAAPRSLVSRLTRLNLAVLSLTLLLTLALIATLAWLRVRDRQVQAAELSAVLLANSLAPALAFSDRDAVRNELAAFSRRADLLEVLVLDSSQGLVGQWKAPGLAVPPRVAAPSELQQARTELVEDELQVWVPVQFKGETLGSLRLRESLKSLQRDVLRMLLMAAVLTLVAIALAARALQTVQRRALAPLVELSDLAEQVAQTHDYSRRGRLYRPDEVGRLTERFNEMLKRIEVWQADLNQQLKTEQAVGLQYQQLAHYDSLTQLPNRHFFQQEIQRMVSQTVRDQCLSALMFIDLDNFKMVNDRHGHEAGDEVLREVARRMSAVLRLSDRLCRLGGDEFALLLPTLPDEAGAEHLAGRLVAAVREPMLVHGELMPVGATVGLAFCPLDARDAAGLLNRADGAMYAAKRAGKNTFRRALRHEDPPNA